MAEKYPFPLNVIRRVYPLLERLSPNLAGKLAVNLFLTPVRFGFTEKEKEFLPQLEEFTFQVGDKTLAGYKMGKGPAVICMHGWAGRALQFRLFAEALAKHGYQFVAFDAWAHGKSPGKKSSIIDFHEGLKALVSQQDNVKAIISHSLGAATSSYYISQGGNVPALVTLGAPVIAQDILTSFSETVNASHNIHRALRQGAVERYNVTFEGVAMETTFKDVNCPVFGLHGTEDKDVPDNHLDVLKKIKPEMNAKKYKGLGHRRILKDEQVIQDVINWLKAH